MANQHNLENIVERESKKKKGLAKKIASYGLNTAAAVGATAIGMSVAGAAAPILGTTYALAHMAYDAVMKKKKKEDSETYESSGLLRYLKSYTTGNLASIAFEWIHNISMGLIPNQTLGGKLLRGAVGGTAGAAAYGAAYTPIDYVSQTGSIKGLGSHMKKQIGKNMGDFVKYYGLPIALLENNIALGYPGVVLGAALNGYADRKEKKDYNRLPQTQLSPA
jgi:hypothetical protein